MCIQTALSLPITWSNFLITEPADAALSSFQALLIFCPWRQHAQHTQPADQINWLLRLPHGGRHGTGKHRHPQDPSFWGSSSTILIAHLLPNSHCGQLAGYISGECEGIFWNIIFFIWVWTVHWNIKLLSHAILQAAVLPDSTLHCKQALRSLVLQQRKPLIVAGTNAVINICICNFLWRRRCLTERVQILSIYP